MIMNPSTIHEVVIDGHSLTIESFVAVARFGAKVSVSPEAIANMQKSRDLAEKIAAEKRVAYGITTGFGDFAKVAVPEEMSNTLSTNLILSHCTATGEPYSEEVVRGMLLLRANALCVGVSGVRPVLVTMMAEMLNKGVVPVVPQKGSLGASGDLAPLANMCLPLLGLGEVEYKGARRPSDEVLKEFGWKPISLQSKEGLALLNGTQFMSAFGVYSLIKARRLSEWADLIGAMSLDAFDGRINPFIDEVHEIRAHKGQLTTARNFRRLLEGSEMIARPKKHVQDPYSFRCIPQVHGASKDTIDYVGGVLETEINSPTDNPTIFPEKDIIVSAGNFHGQPIALAMDFLAIAVAELGNISERRIYKLISGARELPSFLVAKPGLNSGFMIPQYAAASIVSQSKGLCWPASCDSIPSSQGQEDHVSMGSNAATKLYRVVLNTERVLAIELLNAAQALEFRRPLRSSKPIEDLLAAYRKHVPFVENDQVMYTLIDASVKFLQTEKL